MFSRTRFSRSLPTRIAAPTRLALRLATLATFIVDFQCTRAGMVKSGSSDIVTQMTDTI
jgi:hypothetical protein